MKKVFVILTLIFVLAGCQREEEIKKVEINDEIYSTEELKVFMDEIMESKEDFLSGITYFQINIKPQELKSRKQPEIIWLQINKESTKLTSEEISKLIEEKVGVPKELFRVDLVDEKIEYIPAMETWA